LSFKSGKNLKKNQKTTEINQARRKQKQTKNLSLSVVFRQTPKKARVKL
jgi:hypothetical protein